MANSNAGQPIFKQSIASFRNSTKISFCNNSQLYNCPAENDRFPLHPYTEPLNICVFLNFSCYISYNNISWIQQVYRAEKLAQEPWEPLLKGRSVGKYQELPCRGGQRWWDALIRDTAGVQPGISAQTWWRQLYLIKSYTGAAYIFPATV